VPEPSKANRWLLLLLLALACLAVPAGAAGGGVSIDPVVRGTAGANGWYVSNVTVNWTFDPLPDSTTGCDAVRITAEGHTHLDCNAWWGATHVDYPLDIYVDKTPPTVGSVTAKHGNRSVLLAWTESADTKISRVTRTAGPSGPSKVVYQGTDKAFRDKGLRVGTEYRYTVTAFDQARNGAASTRGITATGALINPVPGQRVTSAPRLDWLPAKGATYYNVQLIRGKRILSAWPAQTSLKLRRSWTFHGHRYRLRPGVYRWYVWPGLGKRKQAHYGRLLGSNTFVYGR
jgi:hypothetical protein